MKILLLIVSGCICLLLIACSTSPTGQTQLKFFPDSQMAKMGVTAYEDIKQKTPVSKDANALNYVTCVANAITRETPSKNTWEVTLFEDDAVNAFALPGGKIGVYTGLLKVANNQNQLAAVLGHEVAHVIADHGNARVSTAYATDTGLQLIQVLSGTPSPEKTQLFGLLGLGAQVGVLLPYGRGQESEADILGLQYMARAGFDPSESVILWQNMLRLGGKQPPEFLSTHPSNETRINELKKNMPQAMKVYKEAQGRNKNPQCK